MKALRKLGLMVVIPAVAVLMMFSGAMAQGEPCENCGPGAHWVDSCDAGDDEVVNQEVLVGIGPNPNGPATFNLRMKPDGPCAGSNLTILRGTPVVVDNGSHSASIATEITNLCVHKDGIVLQVGAQHGLPPSTGSIDELSGDSTLANSWFNVYVKVSNAGFPVLYNHDAIHISSIITCVPPDDVDYIHLGGGIPLYETPPPGNPGDVPVMYIVDAVHKVNPDTTFEGCGTLIQGVECVLFDSDDFGVYILSNYGSFNVGDRVLVTGLIPPDCISFCMQGDGCIVDNTIVVCYGDIPTLSEWGMIIFCGLLFAWMAWMVVRRKRATEVGI